MIVICTKCQAKFRVADDRIGPRGAKVRCSRCQTVFAVQPPPPLENPFVTDPVRAPQPPPPAPARPPPLPAPAAPRPLAAAPFPDPFQAAARAAPDADPFAAPPPGLFAATADPFAPSRPAASADPFAAGPAPELPGLGGPSGPPVTDLADLLGDAGAPPPSPAPADAFAADDAFVDAGATPSDLGLSLEERVTPPPVPAAFAAPAPTAFAADAGTALETASPDDPFASAPAEGGAFDAGAFGAGALALGGAAEAIAPSPSPPPAAAPVSALPAGPPPAVASEAVRAPAGVAVAPPAASPGRVPAGSRLRTVLVNAVALAALLVVALALLVVWRTDGPLDASALRPAAILAVLSSGGGASGPFAAQEIRSGLYERERGPPVLFVRGKVVSRAAAPVRALAVAVEVVRDGEVVARGTALAGAVPTAEELYLAPDAAALAVVAKAADARAPREVRPGQSVPFLVAIADHPADLDRATLRVAVAPAGGAAR